MTVGKWLHLWNSARDRTLGPRGRIRRAGLVAGVVLSGACAGGPPPDAISDARNAAARFALAGRAFALSLVKQCRFDPESGTDLSSSARSALAAWTERNEETIAAAQLYIRDFVLVTARREGRREADIKERELAAQQTTDGIRAANEALSRAGGRGSCPELLRRLEAGDLDFASADFEPILDELRERYPSQPDG